MRSSINQSINHDVGWLTFYKLEFGEMSRNFAAKTAKRMKMDPYKVVHGLAPEYLGPFTRVADLPSRRSLRSVGTNRLVVPTSSRLSTVGSRAFPIADPQTWNDLPEDVTSAESLTTFRHLLKTHLFRKSFSDYLLDINRLSPVDLAAVPLLRPPKIVWLIDWLIDCYCQRRNCSPTNIIFILHRYY